MAEQDQPMARYLKRVLALKDERRQIPSAEELKEVAREIGLTDADLAEVERSAEDHYLRGQGFLDHGRYGDAISELEESAALAPRRVEWLHALARAHAGRWQEERGPADRERAELLARQCLELDPRHQASIAILDDLDRTPAAPARPPRRKARRARLIALAALAIVFIGTNVLLRSGDDPDPSPATPRVETPEPSGAVEPAASASTELDIPVTLDAGSTDAALGLEVRKARLARYADGSAFLTVNAVLSNLGDNELDKLGMRLEHLDENGNVVLSDAFDGLNSASPVVRPRDVFPLHLLKESRDSVRQARLVAETVDQNPGAPSYPPAREIELHWQVERPAGLEITARERDRRFSENAIAGDGSGYFDAVLEIENTGERTIRALKLAAEITGPGGAWTATDENHAVLVSGPSLRPGEVWVERLIEPVEGRPEGYRVSVVAVR